MTACTIPLPTLMSFFLKDMPFTLPPEHVMVDPPAVVKVLPSDMSARVTAPWMTWCLTMSGSAWCDMRSILVVPSFWASSTKASSLGQKTVMGPALVRRPSQLVCVDRAGAMGCQFLHPPRSRRSEKRAASGCEQTRVDKGDPRVVASGATSINAAMRRCRVHARGDIGVGPATPRVRGADRAARRVYRSASSSRENRWAIDRVNKCAIVGIGVRGVVPAGRCIGVSVDSPWRWRRRRDRSWRS